MGPKFCHQARVALRKVVIFTGGLLALRRARGVARICTRLWYPGALDGPCTGCRIIRLPPPGGGSVQLRKGGGGL